MAYDASIVADSISPAGYRLTTMLAVYPRFVHSEHLRHRAFSYSVASSRALPTSKLIAQVETDPVLPVWWGAAEKGMQAYSELEGPSLEAAKMGWLKARDDAVAHAKGLASQGLSKQLVNRVLEPWMWITVLVTGTDWENFFHLRCHHAAQPEIRFIAQRMEKLYRESTPQLVRPDMWHLPFIKEEDWIDADPNHEGVKTYYSPAERLEDLRGAESILKKVSAGRVARTSYLTHLGTRDLSEDVALHDRLLAGAKADPPEPMHLSPTEHIATPLPTEEIWTQHEIEDHFTIVDIGSWGGWEALARHLNKRANLTGWKSYRFTIPGEAHLER